MTKISWFRQLQQNQAVKIYPQSITINSNLKHILQILATLLSNCITLIGQMYSQYQHQNYPYYTNPNAKLPKPDPKIAQLQSDNKQLSIALQQLNQCYAQKVKILEEELQTQKQRTEELLTQRREYIDKCLFCNEKYEEEISRLISTMDQINQKYQQETSTMQNNLKQKEAQSQEQQQQLCHLRDQNQYLRNQRDAQQERIQQLVRTYISEIQKLKNQLKQLKEEDSTNKQDSECQNFQQQSENVLREISSGQNNASNLPCQVVQPSKNIKIVSVPMAMNMNSIKDQNFQIIE